MDVSIGAAAAAMLSFSFVQSASVSGQAHNHAPAACAHLALQYEACDLVFLSATEVPELRSGGNASTSLPIAPAANEMTTMTTTATGTSTTSATRRARADRQLLCK